MKIPHSLRSALHIRALRKRETVGSGEIRQTPYPVFPNYYTSNKHISNSFLFTLFFGGGHHRELRFNSFLSPDTVLWAGTMLGGVFPPSFVNLGLYLNHATLSVPLRTGLPVPTQKKVRSDGHDTVLRKPEWKRKKGKVVSEKKINDAGNGQKGLGLKYSETHM